VSSGKVHAISSVVLAGGFLAGGLILKDPSCFEYAAGSLAGILLSPDLDVDAKNLSYKFFRKYKTETLWSALWHFYRKSIKHGSELSHFPVVSTLGRLAYIFLFCITLPNLLLSFVGWNFREETQWWYWQTLTHWKLWLGLAGSDFIHYVLDIATVQDKFNINSLFSGKTNFKRRSL
jgi:Uncharacterized metal-binding protein